MKVHLRTLGCRLNQSEIDSMARQLRGHGSEVLDAPEQAEHIIVNTCAVTGDAAHSSRKLVRQLHRANPAAQITVTGCYAQIAPAEIAVLPGVSAVVGNLAKDALVSTLTGQPAASYEREPLEREAAPWSGRTRAFLKVQDGCDNACTFCVTTIARGEGRSRAQSEILAEVRQLLAMGYQEIVLTGVHLGSYGHDHGEAHGLQHLVRLLLAETDVPRLRLSSLEPWDLDEQFFALWENPRLCPHLHLPLQSGCDRTLRRMARKTSQAHFSALVAAVRCAVAQPAITTDVIAGFPGESDDEFRESVAFIEEIGFAGLHVFGYSRRPGTAAARMRGHVPEALRRERVAALIALGQRAEADFAMRRVGQRASVLWEQVAGASEHGFINAGYTADYLRVTALDRRALTQRITPVLLTGWDETRRALQAEVLSEEPQQEGSWTTHG